LHTLRQLRNRFLGQFGRRAEAISASIAVALPLEEEQRPKQWVVMAEPIPEPVWMDEETGPVNHLVMEPVMEPFIEESLSATILTQPEPDLSPSGEPQAPGPESVETPESEKEPGETVVSIETDKSNEHESIKNIDSVEINEFQSSSSFARMQGMNQPIVIVSGSKGGVGKSLTTMALLDYYAVNHKYLKLIDADTNNPDVWRCYGRTADGEVIDLEDVDGWIRLVNLCDASPFKAVVVNTPAQSNASVHKHAAILLDSMRELGRPLITLWVINRQRDSLELLKDYMDHMPGGVVNVVCNGYFGEQAKFELYEKSTVRETVGSLGGKSLFLPDLADRVTDELYGKRTTLAEATQQLKLGDRAELQRWRTAVAAMFAEVGL
jgi:hypothetical protein